MKKIALSSVLIALFGTVLAATPASANVPTIAVSVGSTSITNATASATPATVTVPSDNLVDAADAVRFALSNVETGTTISVVATNAFIVPALNSSATSVTSASGVTTWSASVGTGTTAEFFVYTKSTATGSVAISNKGNTYVYYVKGTAGPAYNIDVTAESAVNVGATSETQIKVTDVFGNVVGGTTPVVTAINATAGTVSASDTTTGVSKVTLTFPKTVGKSAVQYAITATDVTGLPAAKKTVITQVDITDLASLLAAEKAARAADAAAAAKAIADAKAASDAALAAANAEITKLKTDAAKAAADAVALKAATDKSIADLKKAYNSLVKKWNAKNPRAKIKAIK